MRKYAGFLLAATAFSKASLVYLTQLAESDAGYNYACARVRAFPKRRVV
jgi:hypothetical protein